MGGQPPVNARRVGGKHNTVKQADSGFRGRCARKSRGTPEDWSRLCVLSGLFPHDLCHGRDSPCWLAAPLEKGRATHASILYHPWGWTVSSMGLQRVRHDWVTKLNWELKYTLNRYEQWYSAGSQHEESRPWQRSWGRKPNKIQGHDQASGVPPGISWASTHKNQSLPALLCYAFHLLFWH